MDVIADERSVRIIVMAKAPTEGRSKTRMVPPLTGWQAAEVAAAALADTLAAVKRTPGIRPVLALDGDLAGPPPPGFHVTRQRGHSLADRLTSAFEDAGTPAVAVSADTPQVTPELLSRAAREISRPGVGALLGPCPDGGYWAIGLRDFDPGAFHGVPMSSPDTFTCQRSRLEELGLIVEMLPSLRDADFFDDAVSIAEAIPASKFAATVRRCLETLSGEETA